MQSKTAPHAVTFFNSAALHNISSKELKLDQRQQVSEALKRIDCPRSTVARLAGVYLSDLSGWLNNRSDISQDKIERIAELTADIAEIVQGIKQSPIPVPIDLSDCEGMKQLIETMRAMRQTPMDAPLNLQDLRTTESDAAAD